MCSDIKDTTKDIIGVSDKELQNHRGTTPHKLIIEEGKNGPPHSRKKRKVGLDLEQQSSNPAAVGSPSGKRQCTFEAALVLASLNDSSSASKSSAELQQNKQATEYDDISEEQDTTGDYVELPSKPKLNSANEKKNVPEKLMEILSRNDFSHTIKWLPSGKAFIFVDTEKFVEKVMPLYFKKTKFDSFVRKLHRWGFRLVKNGPDNGSFVHKNFVRDRPELCCLIECVPSQAANKPYPPLKASLAGRFSSTSVREDVPHDSSAAFDFANNNHLGVSSTLPLPILAGARAFPNMILSRIIISNMSRSLLMNSRTCQRQLKGPELHMFTVAYRNAMERININYNKNSCLSYGNKKTALVIQRALDVLYKDPQASF